MKGLYENTIIRGVIRSTSSGVLVTTGNVSSTLFKVLQARVSTAWIGFSNVFWTIGKTRLAAKLIVSSAVDQVFLIKDGLES